MVVPLIKGDVIFGVRVKIRESDIKSFYSDSKHYNSNVKELTKEYQYGSKEKKTHQKEGCCKKNYV